MKVKVLKPCVINGKPHKAGKKEITVSKKDGGILVSLGKVEDLTPKKEPVALNLNVDVSGLEEVKKEIIALTERVEELTSEGEVKDEMIAVLTKENELLISQLEEISTEKKDKGEGN